MVKKLIISQKIKSIIYAGLLIVSLLVLLASLRGLNNAKSKLVEQRQRVSQLDLDISALDSIVADSKVYEEKIKTLKATLPGSYSEVAVFARTLDEIADSEEEVLTVNIEKEKVAESGYSSLKFSITTEGSFTSLKNTLTYLSSIPYHTSVDALKVEDVDGKLTTFTNFRLLMK